MTTRSLVVLWLTAVVTFGCAKRYEAPKANEPAATVKMSFDYSRNASAQAVPPGSGSPGIAVKVNVQQEKDTFVAYEKGYPINLEAKNEMNGDAIRLHPGKPVTLAVSLSVVWTVTKIETVTKYRTEYRYETQTQSYYDAASKSTRMQTVQVQVPRQVPYQVTEPVTRPYSLGCTATTPLEPEKDAVYQLDYVAPTVETGCAVKLTRQG